MSQKTILLKGAFFLTAAGIAGRILGFFYRIFLSRAIGAEGVGIYQLIFPVYALAASLTVSGIQTCISRFVSAKTAAGDPRGARSVFSIGLALSLLLSLITSALLVCFHDVIATEFVKEARASQLLYLLAPAIPFGAVHACINGYYFGLKKTTVPAVGQILEHLLRLLSVMLLVCIFSEKGLPVTPAVAVYGIVIEEIAASLFSATALALHFSGNRITTPARHTRRFYLRELLSFATPLTLNRVLVNVLQTVEALLVPIQLQVSGMPAKEALCVYGVLTGMALPLILFPTAVTSSISTLLLPIISEAQAKGNRRTIARAIRKTCGACLALGFLCFLAFFTLGRYLGVFLFDNALAGEFITSLAWICPLLYLSPILLSILNGLGKSADVFLHNVFSVLVRILFIVAVMPRIGISGYFYGVLASQLLLFALALYSLKLK